jgi:predicted nucleic acid-binding protein
LAAFLVDTNILAYVYDPRDTDRQAGAAACLRQLAHSRQGALTAQILGELFWVATRRLDRL